MPPLEATRNSSNISRGAELNFVRIAKPAGDFVDDLPVFARTFRRRDGLAMPDYAAFDIGRRTLIFFHQ